MSRFLDSFQYATRLRKVNRLVQIVLILVFIFGLNYLATNIFWRSDLTQRHLFSLSPETIGYLREIREPVKVIVTMTQDSPRDDERMLARYVRDLLRQYQYAARSAGADLELEFVDIYKDLARAGELARQYQLEQPNVVLFTSGDRRRIILPTEILEFEDLRPVAFKGEQAFTSAIIEVAAQSRPVLYFVIGHAEMRPDDASSTRGLSLLTRELQMRNFAVGNLDLSQVESVPADANLVVIVDPQGPLLPSEQEKLRRYLNDRAGRVMLFLSPGRIHGLDDLLYEWGIQTDDMVILEQGSDYLEGSGNYLIRNFGEHPITEILIRNQTYVITGLSRPVRPDPGSPFDERLRVTALLASSSESWAERSYRDARTPVFNPDVDLPGPVPIGVVAERRAASQLGINIQGGRIIAFGSGDMAANRRISALGNYNLFFSSLNWILDRNLLIAIPPRQIEQYQLVASQSDMQRIALLFLIVPASVAALGLIVIWFRKW